MPYSNVYNYIGAVAFSDTTIYNQSDLNWNNISLKQQETQEIGFWFREAGGITKPEPNELTAIYIGIPTGTASDSTVIPFVVLDMNGTNS